MHAVTPSPARPVDDVALADDLRTRLDPTRCTRLLHDAAPVVAAVGFRYLEVGDGTCSGVVPLTTATANQHGTHQSLVVAMGGDYVGGLAVASLLRGVPILGVHPDPDGAAMSLWTVATELTWLRPSTGDVIARATVAPDDRAALRARYDAGASARVSVPVDFHAADGTAIGRGRFTYFVRAAAALATTAADQPLHPMHAHLQRSSATMIAAVRGFAAAQPGAGFGDELATALAGAQGAIIGARFRAVLPPLATMIAGRTGALDATIADAAAAGVAQVVLLAAGLDARPTRLAARHPALRWFALDLPEMLAFRAQRFATIGATDRATAVAADLRFTDWPTALRAAGLDVTRPTLLALEGASMYLTAAELDVVLGRAAAALGGHATSRLWLDVVTGAVVARRLAAPSVAAFLDGLARLGEPFRGGVDHAAARLAAHRLALVHDRPSVLDDADPLFAHHRVVLARPA